MKSIDFLPERYRQRRAARRAHTWEVCVVALFGLLIAGAAAWQYGERRKVVRELEALKPVHQQAMNLAANHQQLQADLQKSSEAAELYFYLEHPWPRTQILVAIHNCLPDDVWLTQLHLTHDVGRSNAAPIDNEALAKLSPVLRDLDKLRREADRRAGIVWISGQTRDATSVYQLAHDLSQAKPFSAVKVELVENQEEGGVKRTSFKLRGTLTAAYGLPGGPQPAASPGMLQAATRSPNHLAGQP